MPCNNEGWAQPGQEPGAPSRSPTATDSITRSLSRCTVTGSRSRRQRKGLDPRLSVVGCGHPRQQFSVQQVFMADERSLGSLAASRGRLSQGLRCYRGCLRFTAPQGRSWNVGWFVCSACLCVIWQHKMLRSTSHAVTFTHFIGPASQHSKSC